MYTTPTEAITISLALFAFSIGYAVFLHRIRHIYSKYFTAATVVVGFLLTYAGPLVYLLLNPEIGGWELFAFTLHCTFATGTPILAWQLWDGLTRYYEAHLYETQETANGTTTHSRRGYSE
jgi:hypothetical protein